MSESKENSQSPSQSNDEAPRNTTYDEVKEGFTRSQIGHVASEVDHDIRNEDWDDPKKGWDKIRWNNRAMALALVTIRKREEEIEGLKKYIHENKLHLPDCHIDNWKLCTCGLETHGSVS
jgi:hypothetical protein